jgi:hypothetical protein
MGLQMLRLGLGEGCVGTYFMGLFAVLQSGVLWCVLGKSQRLEMHCRTLSLHLY